MPHSQVTRVEIAGHIERAFARGSATRSDMVHSAESNGARSEIIDALNRLPVDHTYPTMRDIWKHLEHVPVENIPAA